MRRNVLWATGVVAVVAVAVAVWRPATAQNPAAGGAGGPRYTIVETDGTNLLVVDNGTNQLHYYTVDEGKAVGEDLKLRGSIDLTEVGKPVIKPKPAAK